MKQALSAVTALLLLCSVAWAEPPVGKIEGPHTAHQGALIILDASGSEAEFFDWYIDTSKVKAPVDPETDNTAVIEHLRGRGWRISGPVRQSEPLWLISPDGRKVHLSSYPGTYRISLAVGSAEGVAQVQWVVTVNGGVQPDPDPEPEPTPGPDPEPIPDDIFSLALRTTVTAIVAQTPSAREAYQKLGGAYLDVADGCDRGTYKTLADAKADIIRFSRAVLVSEKNIEEWSLVLEALVEPHLMQLDLDEDAAPTAVAVELRKIGRAIKAGAE